MRTLDLHELVGNRSPMAVPNKARWVMRDLRRQAARYDIPFAMNRNFPMNMLDVMHGAYVAMDQGVLEAYCDAIFPAVWVEGVDVDDRDAVGRVLAAASLDAEAILAVVDDPAVHEALVSTTREAAERGAFGAPTFFVADEMHFGQDRLDFVEEALRR